MKFQCRIAVLRLHALQHPCPFTVQGDGCSLPQFADERADTGDAADRPSQLRESARCQDGCRGGRTRSDSMVLRGV
jgi:hypothetical protein